MNPLAFRSDDVSRALARALPAQSRLEDAKDISWAGGIDPRRVVAVAWSRGRLARAKRLLAEGSPPPPIEVTRYRIEGVPELWFYLPSDGVHRARAAQLARRGRIGARVNAVMPCRPRGHLLCSFDHEGERSTFLYENAPARPYARRVPIGTLTEDEVRVLRALGVPDLDEQRRERPHT